MTQVRGDDWQSSENRANDHRHKSGCDKLIKLCELKNVEEAKRMEAAVIHLLQFHPDFAIREQLTNMSTGGCVTHAVYGISYFVYALLQDDAKPELLPGVEKPEKYVKRISRHSREDLVEIHDGLMAKMLAQIGDDDFCAGFSQHFFRRMKEHDRNGYYRKLRPEEREKALLLRSGDRVRMKDGRVLTMQVEDIL
jgi:hypothetical protein